MMMEELDFARKSQDLTSPLQEQRKDLFWLEIYKPLSVQMQIRKRKYGLNT